MNNLHATFWFEYTDVVFCTAGILHQSLAGAMLSKILHSLLLLPVGCVQSLLFHLLGILAPLDCLNRVLPDGVHCEHGRNSLPEGVQCEQESNSSSGKCLFCCTIWLCGMSLRDIHMSCVKFVVLTVAYWNSSLLWCYTFSAVKELLTFCRVTVLIFRVKRHKKRWRCCDLLISLTTYMLMWHNITENLNIHVYEFSEIHAVICVQV